MARNIFIVNATQVVVSDANPQGIFSVISGYPKNYDSMSFNYDPEAALRAAKSEYYSRLSANYAGSANRVMATVTLSQANGQLVMRDSVGTFPVVTPAEPEPEPETEEPVEEPEQP
jgi:hypothetical protein